MPRKTRKTESDPAIADAQGETPPQAAPSEPQSQLSALLGELEELRQYLEERGKRSSELAQRFTANAQRDPSARAYDERQATMLEYQRYIWAEIAGRVGRLLNRYGSEEN